MLHVTYFVLWLVFMLAAVTAYFTGGIPPFTSLVLGLVGLGLIYGLALWSVIGDRDESHGREILG